jgi:hypothetical protein
MDTANPKPQIATILDDGKYGQRQMTDEEYAVLIESGWTPGEPEEAPTE